MAHIVAFRPDGPRGRSGVRPEDINDVGNLMLLCPGCHKLIDDHPTDYTRKALEQQKAEHERRIRYITGIRPNRTTAVLVLKAPIGGQVVATPFDQLLEATLPRYPIKREPTLIDLSEISDSTPTFIKTAADNIEQRVKRFFEPGGEGHAAAHISVFALAPIPLLVALGRQLSNKVPCDVLQRHRDTEDWIWKKNGTRAEFLVRRRRGGEGPVSLVLSLSGHIPLPLSRRKFAKRERSTKSRSGAPSRTRHFSGHGAISKGFGSHTRAWLARS